MQQTMNRHDMPYTWAQWINVGIGIAVIITPFIANADTAAKTSGVITGIIIGVIAIISFFISRGESGIGISWINILAGIWLLISTSFARDPQLIWQDVVYGILAILTAVIVMGLHNINMRGHRTSAG